MIGADTKWFSLKSSLLLWLLLGMSIAWAVSILLTYRKAHIELDELLDARMVQRAEILLALVGEYESDDDIVSVEEGRHKYLTYQTFQIWDDRARLLLRSALAPASSFTTVEGFSEKTDSAGDRWRYYLQWDESRQIMVIVGENHLLRDNVSEQIATQLLVPGMLGVPLLGIWIWLVMWRGLLPVDRVARSLSTRNFDQLKPPRITSAPREIRPLLESLDSLLTRLGRALESERRFTSDAAHELRTPLAAIATQTQVFSQARNPDEKEHAMHQIEICNKRAIRLVEQLMTLARLDSDTSSMMIREETVHLDGLLAEICAEMSEHAISKNIQLELEIEQAATIEGQPELLRILFRNLIDNALRYTPNGGHILVTARNGLIEVGDNGPGIPEERYADALMRFKRLDPTGSTGSGLGLSIATRIAELHAMTLSFGNNNPGLKVTLRSRT